MYVTLTFDGGRISYIDVDFNMETMRFVDMMHPMVVEQVIADQSTSNINIRNGATMTTRAVLEAIDIILERNNFNPQIVEGN